MAQLLFILFMLMVRECLHQHVGRNSMLCVSVNIQHSHSVPHTGKDMLLEPMWERRYVGGIAKEW